MNEATQKWVEALRSGKYAQTTAMLHVTNGEDKFCCLGVACDLYMKEHDDLVARKEQREHTTPPSFYSYTPKDDAMKPYTTSLPNSVREWLGLRDVYGRGEGVPEGGLTEMNDRGCSFTEIADAIEAEPKGLFA